MANDYFASKGWLTKYAKAEDSTGAWQKYVAEVQRSEMDNFNTPDLDQGADSILRPGETLDDFDVTFRKPNAEGGRTGFEDGMRVMEDKIIFNYKKKRLKELETGKDPSKIQSYEDYIKTQTEVDMNPGKKKLDKAITDAKKLTKTQTKGIATKLEASDFKCKLANGLTCNDPRAYTDSIKEKMAKASQGDKKAISSIKKMGKLMNGFKGAAKWTGWGLLGEIGFAAPLAGLDYAKGANTDEIISNATYGLFGKSQNEQLQEKYSDYGQAQKFKDTYDKLVKQENSLDDQTGYGSIPVHKQVIKDTENKLREQSKEFAEVLPPSMGFKGDFNLNNFFRRQEIDQQRDAEFAKQKQQKSDKLGIIKPSTGLEAIGFEEGGLADLMKKYNDKK